MGKIAHGNDGKSGESDVDAKEYIKGSEIMKVHWDLKLVKSSLNLTTFVEYRFAS